MSDISAKGGAPLDFLPGDYAEGLPTFTGGLYQQQGGKLRGQHQQVAQQQQAQVGDVSAPVAQQIGGTSTKPEAFGGDFNFNSHEPI